MLARQPLEEMGIPFLYDRPGNSTVRDVEMISGSTPDGAFDQLLDRLCVCCPEIMAGWAVQ